EAPHGEDDGGNGPRETTGLLLAPERVPGGCGLLRRMGEDDGAVFHTYVFALPVPRCRVMQPPEGFDQRRIGEAPGIEVHLHHLDQGLLAARFAGVADAGVLHAFEAAQGGFGLPEASGTKGGAFPFAHSRASLYAWASKCRRSSAMCS